MNKIEICNLCDHEVSQNVANKLKRRCGQVNITVYIDLTI